MRSFLKAAVHIMVSLHSALVWMRQCSVNTGEVHTGVPHDGNHEVHLCSVNTGVPHDGNYGHWHANRPIMNVMSYISSGISSGGRAVGW